MERLTLIIGLFLALLVLLGSVTPVTATTYTQVSYTLVANDSHGDISDISNSTFMMSFRYEGDESTYTGGDGVGEWFEFSDDGSGNIVIDVYMTWYDAYWADTTHGFIAYVFEDSNGHSMQVKINCLFDMVMVPDMENLYFYVRLATSGGEYKLEWNWADAYGYRLYPNDYWYGFRANMTIKLFYVISTGTWEFTVEMHRLEFIRTSKSDYTVEVVGVMAEDDTKSISDASSDITIEDTWTYDFGFKAPANFKETWKCEFYTRGIEKQDDDEVLVFVLPPQPTETPTETSTAEGWSPPSWTLDLVVFTVAGALAYYHPSLGLLTLVIAGPNTWERVIGGFLLALYLVYKVGGRGHEA